MCSTEVSGAPNMSSFSVSVVPVFSEKTEVSCYFFFSSVQMKLSNCKTVDLES